MFNSKYTGSQIENVFDTMNGVAGHVALCEISLGSSTFELVESPEFMYCILDGNDKILFGIRNDGSTYYADCDFNNEMGEISLNLYGVMDYMSNRNTLQSLIEAAAASE